MEQFLRLLQACGVSSELQLLNEMSYAMIATGIVSFIALMFTVAPYGKYAEKSQWFFGFPMNGKLAWFLQECPCFLIAAGCWWYALQDDAKTDPSIKNELAGISKRTVLLSMYLFHYFNRSFIYPLRIRGGKPTPFVIFLMALAFCVYNGYLQGRYLTAYYEPAAAPAAAAQSTGSAAQSGDSLLSPHFIVGFCMYATGMAINWQSDDILRNLRKPGETGYKIPRGGAFDFVSGANFFGEILEWAGYAVAAWSLPAAAFAIFTFCNIGPRGYQHHQWYLSKFRGEYPADRKAVIPFLW